MVEIHEVLNAYADNPNKLKLTLNSNQELKVVKKSTFKNFYGRVVSSRSGNNCDFSVVTEFLRTLPPSELRLVSHNFYKVINQKIDSCNLKKSLSTIENIVFQVFAEDVSNFDFKNIILIKNPKVAYTLYEDYSTDCICWYDVTIKTGCILEVTFSLNLKLTDEGIELIQPVFPGSFEYNKLCHAFKSKYNKLLPSVFYRYCCALNEVGCFDEKLYMYPYDISVQNYLSSIEVFSTDYNGYTHEELKKYSYFKIELSEADNDLLVKFYLFFLDAANILPHWWTKYSYRVTHENLRSIANLKIKIIKALVKGTYDLAIKSFFAQFFHDVDRLIETVSILRSQHIKKSAHTNISNIIKNLN